MRNKYCLSLLALLSFLGAFAQNIKVEGYILDTLQEPIELANAILSTTADSTFTGFCITNPKGRFLIENIAPGDYFLSLSFLGYDDVIKYITFTDSDEEINIGNITLQESTELLDQINISAQRVPIKIKKDTIEYNADAFKTQANDNVEELLKKLPGVEVEKDGSITAQGEDVGKVLVDGKEFFGNDPTLATKNLPANVIKNVQVFDKKSKNADFSGIDDGQRTKTINLTLKDEKKNGLFGTASAGYGQRDRAGQTGLSASTDQYAGKISLNRFSKNSQLSVIGMLNNTNEQGFSFREYISFMGGFSKLGGSGRFNFGNAGVPISNDLGSGFIETNAIGINYNYDIGKNSSINVNYFYNHLENQITSSLEKEVLIQDRGFDESSLTNQINSNSNHKAVVVYDQEIDSMQNMSLDLSASWNDGTSNIFSTSENFRGDNLISGSDILNESNGTSFSLDGEFDYRRKFAKKGRFLTLDLDYNLSNSDQDAILDSDNFFILDQQIRTDSFINQNQIQNGERRNYKVGFSYTESMGKRRYLEFNASRQNYSDDVLKDFYDLYPLQEPNRVLNNLLSNFFRQDYDYTRGGLNMKWNKRKSTLTLGGSLQYANLKGQVNNGESITPHDYVFLLPSGDYRLDISKSRNFSINYRTSINEPSVSQLSPIVDNSNPLRVSVGNPDLRPEYNHRISFRYRSFSQFNNITFFSNLTFQYTSDNIANNVEIDNFGVEARKPVNLDNSFSVSTYVNFSAPIKFIKKDIRLTNRFSINQNPSFINNVLNETNRINNTITASINNWNEDIVSIEVGTRYNLNSTKYSVNSDQNQFFITRSYFSDIAIDFAKRWTFETDFNWAIYSQESFGEQTEIAIWNAGISALVLESKKLKLGFVVRDLLNQNLVIQRNADITSLQEQRIESLARYFMVTAAYSFSGFGKESSGRSWH